MRRFRICTNEEHGVFQRLVIQGVRATAEAHGWAVEVDTESARRGTVTSLSADEGIHVIANALPNEQLRALFNQNVAITLVSHHIPELPIPTVVFNNAQGIALLVKHLVEDCGRRKIVFVKGIPDQFDAIEREAQFRAELMRHALDADGALTIPGDFSPDVAVDSLTALQRQQVHFDAVLAADYVMARAITQHLRAQGIHVPEEVAVAGFGDAPEAEQAGITTAAADVKELGRCAGLQLLSQMNGIRIRGRTTLAVELVVRSSTANQAAG